MPLSDREFIDFEFVGVPQNIGYPETTSGARKIEANCIGYGPDVSVTKRKISAWRDDKETRQELEYVGIVEQAVKNGTPLHFSGYKTPTESGKGYFYTGQRIKVWDGVETSAPATSPVPGDSAPSHSSSPPRVVAQTPDRTPAVLLSMQALNAAITLASTLPQLHEGDDALWNDKEKRVTWIRNTAKALIKTAFEMAEGK